MRVFKVYLKADAGRTASGWSGRLKFIKRTTDRLLSVRPKDGFRRRTVKIFSKRTEADGGQILLVRLKDGFGRRTLKKFWERTEADGGRSPIVRFKDEFGRRTGKISKKRTEADAGRRRTKSVPRALVSRVRPDQQMSPIWSKALAAKDNSKFRSCCKLKELLQISFE